MITFFEFEIDCIWLIAKGLLLGLVLTAVLFFVRKKSPEERHRTIDCFFKIVWVIAAVYLIWSIFFLIRINSDKNVVLPEKDETTINVNGWMVGLEIDNRRINIACASGTIVLHNGFPLVRIADKAYSVIGTDLGYIHRMSPGRLSYFLYDSDYSIITGRPITVKYMDNEYYLRVCTVSPRFIAAWLHLPSFNDLSASIEGKGFVCNEWDEKTLEEHNKEVEEPSE